MVVQMITCQVRKDTAGKLQSADSFLRDGVRTYFHESIFAAFVCHTSQKTVQRNRVRSSVFGRDGFIVYIIAYRRDKPHFVTEIPECII